ncbi:MAG TPA: 3-hydroxyacyl-ACP dehydratase [Cytophagales bacterium]|jgi:3-hydroxyacyl-[acyl-carrier-protein] dehydratase|nr:3-hydroxyacyl-ACP dehydratase [Cytophagales bacterium]
MLKNDLFTIHSLKETTSGHYEVVVNLDKGHDIFKGHFPGKPILPGVCQVEIIAELLEEIFEKSYRLEDANMIKFQALVDPNENDTLYFGIDATIEGNRVKTDVATNLGNGEVSFKLKGNYIHE